MPTIYTAQESPADARRSASQGMLIIASAPAAAVAKIGLPLLDAGALTDAGVYSCYIDTHGWSALEVVLMPSAVTGTFAPSLQRLYYSREAVRTTVAGSNFSAGAAQTLTTTTIIGTQQFRVDFTVPGGGSITFDAGVTASSPAALAEYNGA